jgi:ACS family tartrate transporter-like MFS transporter
MGSLALAPFADLERATLRRVFWRLVPLLCVLYLFNILDRANVGFARLRMQDDLALSERTFNLGYGIFYLGYLLFEVPSNLLMRRVGARLWIARIMISWGVVSMATMFVWDAWSFYAVRILLGVAEAGFFPGIILYLSYWFPDRERGRVTACFMLAIGLSSVVGNPASGIIMHFCDGALGLHGWQWLFALEGLPSVLLGFVVFRALTDYPHQATWLAAEQRDWLVQRMQQEESQRRQTHGAERLTALLPWRVWLLIVIYSSVTITANASGAYLPRLVDQQFPGLQTWQIGLVSAVPQLCAVVGMTLVGISSDRWRERRGHFAASALVAAGGWSLAAWAPTPVAALVGLCLAQTGMMSMLPVFWTIPTLFLSGAAAAGGIALINSVANIGGIFAPTILGEFGLMSMAIILVAGAALTPLVRLQPARAAADKETVQ